MGDRDCDNEIRKDFEMEEPSETSVFLPTTTTKKLEAEEEIKTVPIGSENGSPKTQQNLDLENGTEDKAIEIPPKDKDDESEVKSQRNCCRTYAGILLTLASGFVYMIGGVIIKYMKGYHPFTLGVYRFQGIFIPNIIWVLYVRYWRKEMIFDQIWPPSTEGHAKKLGGMAIRCIFGTTGLFLHFYALQRIDVADVIVIGACQPVFVTFAAYFLLGEALGIIPVLCALLTIVGVAVISRPPILTGHEAFDQDALIGSAFSMGSVFAATLVFVVIRYLKDVHVSVLTLILGTWGTIISVICSVIIGEFRLPETLEHWGLAGALALVTLLAQVGFTLALQCEQAGPVALVRACDCVFAFLLQFVFLNAVPDLYSLTGAAIIIFCVVLTALRKWVGTLPEDSPNRRRFAFVMK